MKLKTFVFGCLIMAMPAMTLPAQNVTVLHTFTSGSDGGNPIAGLLLAGNALYGTTSHGGTNNEGTVFSVNTGGSNFTLIHTFNGSSDGGHPSAGLVLSGNTFYGTAVNGGTNDSGSVFSFNTNGTDFTVLHTFNSAVYGTNYIVIFPGLTNAVSNGMGTNLEGARPAGDLVLSGDTLYGTAGTGGTNGSGMVFSLKTNGADFTVLHTFRSGSDGKNPTAGLLLSGDRLYGTAAQGGTNGNGTVFSLDTSGANFTLLHTFNSSSEGRNPSAGLVLSGNTLYGTAQAGGTNGFGTVYSLGTNGADFTVLHTFTDSLDGATPFGRLALSGNILYGTAEIVSAVFSMKTNGANFTVLHNLGGGEGANPLAGLVMSGNTLYGTTCNGALSYGTVFSLWLPMPQLSLIPSGANVILTWPTNVGVFNLQFTTNLAAPACWTTVAQGPVVAHGQNVVTNPISATQHFYRLNQ